MILSSCQRIWPPRPISRENVRRADCISDNFVLITCARLRSKYLRSGVFLAFQIVANGRSFCAETSATPREQQIDLNILLVFSFWSGALQDSRNRSSSPPVSFRLKGMFFADQQNR
jgi:hypothetical protein